jgi:signal transduction histidine kinase
MDDALIKFKAAKKAKCLDAADKKQINTKIQECIQLIVQIKDNQNDKVKELLEGIIQKLTGEKFPD